MIKKLKWKPLNDRRRNKCLAFLHKVICDLVAVPEIDLLELNKHQQSLAFKNDQTCNIDVYKYSFVSQTIQDYNLLPDSIVI